MNREQCIAMAKKMFARKNGNITSALMGAASAAIAFVILAIVFVTGHSTVDSLKTTQTTNSAAYNASATVQTGLTTFTNNSSMWATAAGAGVTLLIIFGTLGGFIYMRGQQD